MRLLRLLRAVMWSFIGVRRGADAARDQQGVRPQTVLAAAFVVVALLVVGIASLVRFIAPQAPAVPAATMLAPPPAVVASPGAPHGPATITDTM